MALQKQSVPINFAQGLETKSDPWQVAPGKFLELRNSVFTKAGLLQKRNGFSALTPLPDNTSTYATTFNGSLTAIGNTLKAYSPGASMWLNKGTLQPLELSVTPLVRGNTNQSQADAVVASNGLACVVYTDNIPSGSSVTPSYKYSIIDLASGQNTVAPMVITPTSGTVTGSPRVFYLGAYFVIVFTVLIGGAYHLQYIAINSITLATNAAINITSAYTPATTVAFDGAVVNNSLYLAWNGNDGGGAIRLTYIDSTLVQHNTVVFAGRVATMMSVTADTSSSTPVIYASFYNSGTNTAYTLAVNQQLNTVHAPTQILAAGSLQNITSTAQNGVCTVFYEIINAYSFNSGIGSNYVKKITITQGGVVGTASVVIRSLGLASKAFIVNSVSYFLGLYSSDFQPTYFLCNASGDIVSKLAYSNGASTYYTTGLPGVTATNGLAQIAYLFKDLIQSVNKSQGAPQAAGIYSQTGINIADFTIGTSDVVSAEIGNNLHLTGGFLWMYDGATPVEHGFHVWPDDVTISSDVTGGGIKAQKYFYAVTYEWTDNEGNIFRSAPSVPSEMDLTNATPTPVTFHATFASGSRVLTVSSATGLFVGQTITDTTTPGNIPANTTITEISGTSVFMSNFAAGTSAASPGDALQTLDTLTMTVNVPTLRLTYKVSRPVKIVIYRWSVNQQVYYQTTSINAPVLNDPTIDSIAYVDTANDNAIIGNNIIYTTGGVLENIEPPALSTLTLFNARLFGIDSENPNQLWYSKQVIQSVPAEMSDLLTIYTAPTVGAQGSSGPNKCLAPLDDKLIIFKSDTLYYINGIGPDNTGANSQYSEPVFITGTVGCSNQHSIVFMPNGLMFESDKGIWLLGRDLSTSYIGAPVEGFTQDATVVSALNIPGTNQVRFTLDNGITLMYDYFYGQWSTFTNIPAVSSTIYQAMHTYINNLGQVFKEESGSYLDGSHPVLMSFTSSWFNLAGLQGYERAYYFYLLGKYLSPHKLQLQIAYDYNSSPSQSVIITPDNFSAGYGSDSLWGGTPMWGGQSDVEQWRVFLQRQKCQAFQISMQEIYDASQGQPAGAGLTLSGINLIVAAKKGYNTLRPSRSVG